MKYKDINDYYLVDMVCENNDDYCNVLFNKYQPVIKKIVYKSLADNKIKHSSRQVINLIFQ